MADIFDYVEKFGSFRFNEMGISDVDNAVFSRLAYLDFSGYAGKTLGEIAEEYKQPNNENKIANDTYSLLKQAGSSIRFGYTALYNCVEIVSENIANAFYAVTFAVDKDTFFIAFRGTDDKIVSFYEDAELAYSFPISSQASALRYVTEELESLAGRFFLGGHSKGGNLALFAYLFLKDTEKERIVRVYNNDGPGFPEDIANILFTKKNCEKILNIMPEDSIIGRMLTDGGRIKIIKSTASGAAQHNIFTWETNGSEFARTEKFSLLSEYMEHTLTQSLDALPPEKMKAAATAVFEIAKKSGIQSLKDINIKNYKSLIPAVSELRKLVDHEDDEIPIIVRTLAKSLVDSINVEKMIAYSLPDIKNKMNDLADKIREKKDGKNSS